jgi:hypothetical protein
VEDARGSGDGLVLALELGDDLGVGAPDVGLVPKAVHLLEGNVLGLGKEEDWIERGSARLGSVKEETASAYRRREY